MNNFINSVTKTPRPDIPMVEVKSNQVKAVGFDAGSNTLAVSFTRGAGAVYHYPNVSPEAHQAFVGAESIGTHFGKHVKALPFEKFEPVKE
jgi:hypothetical protein